MAIAKSNYTKSFTAATHNLGYISREQAKGEERGKIYNQYGEELHKDDIKDLKKDMEGEGMYRRVILSPNPKATHLSDSEMKEYTRDVIDTYKSETGKDFKYVFAVHDHNGIKHSHVISYGSKSDLYLGKKGYDQLKGIANEKEKEYSFEKGLGKMKSLHLGAEKVSEGIEKGEREAEGMEREM